MYVCLFYKTVKAGKFNVYLIEHKIQTTRKCQKESNHFKMSYGSICLIIFILFTLIISFCHQSCFISCNYVIFIKLVSNNLSGNYDKFILRTRDKIPYTILFELIELFLHNKDPTFIIKGNMYLFWFNLWDDWEIIT